MIFLLFLYYFLVLGLCHARDDELFVSSYVRKGVLKVC